MLLEGRVAGGTAFEKLVEAHHSDIHRYLWHVVTLGAAADDLSAETFLRAFRARRSLPVDTDLRPWLFAIATRLCRKHFRGERGRAATLAARKQGRSANGVRPEGETVQDARGRLEAIIRRLPLNQRLAFAMRRFHDLGYDAIGASLGCSAGRAQIHVFDALRRIRRELDAPARGNGGESRQRAAVTRGSDDGTG